MRKLSLKGARVLASIALVLIMCGVTAVCFMPEKSVSIVSGESYAPIYSGRTETAQVALMFNVYENTDVVNGILDVLKSHNAKATFFVGGCWADDNNQTLKRILEEGHSLGNHGYFHKNHKKLTEAQNLAEIKNTHDLVLAITGYSMTLFAPPSGAFSVTTLKVAEKLGYRSIMWSKDTIDWRDNDVNLIVKRATAVDSGDFILMHPKAHTLKALPTILQFYFEKGISTNTVDELIKTQ
ncbi:MAG: polysaccharide deacetylase family protein [Clostridia bacterium]|nr:polysaccharide deacetylase family protein [Clostridia bacterium]MBQ6883189.1 polysaccharide deacetylase family protein [Clostridia bacterium]MBR2933450.1 polysaccharide deacetylase family protein [Clostridia bacterium]MBR6688190.1 polysaccharide deacetylase family protein [Clostridia bacterium]